MENLHLDKFAFLLRIMHWAFQETNGEVTPEFVLQNKNVCVCVSFCVKL